jgi:hypothetical protein
MKVLPLGCSMKIDFHSALIARTLIPLVIIGVIFTAHKINKHRLHQVRKTAQRVRNRPLPVAAPFPARLCM